jgi:autotransporter-associated beta strand protein
MADDYTTYEINVGAGGVVEPGDYQQLIYPNPGNYTLVAFASGNDSSAQVIDNVDVSETTSTYQYSYGYYEDLFGYNVAITEGEGTGTETSGPLTLAGQSDQLRDLAAGQTLDVVVNYELFGTYTYDNPTAQSYPSEAPYTFGVVNTGYSWQVTYQFIGVNDAPVLTASSTQFDGESAEMNPGAPGSGSYGGKLFYNAPATITDYDNNAVKGWAIVGADDTNGTWFYSTDDGAHWSQLVVSDSSALLVASANLIDTDFYFQANANFTGTSTITVRAWDQTQGEAGQKFNISQNGTGGTTAFSATTETVSMVVQRTQFEYSVSGTYASPIQLVSGDYIGPVTPTSFQVDPGVTAVISGAITTGTGTGTLPGYNANGEKIDPNQPIAKTGSGTLVLSGDNTYTGGTTVTAGTLSISADDNLGTGGTLALSDGTTLDLTASFTLAHAVTLAGTVTFDVSAGKTVTDSGGISGSTAVLDKTDSGTLELSASTNFTSLNIDAGTVLIGSSQALQSNIAISIASGATLDLGGFGITIGSLAGAGTVTDSGSAATLTFDAASSPTTFGGVIEDGANAVGLEIKAGAVALSGANTYSGITDIEVGSLIGAAADAFSANSSVTLSSGGTLDLGGFNQAIGLLSGNGIVTNSGTAAAILTTGGSGNTKFAGEIQDGAHAIGLTKTGTGMLTLSGTDTYSGATTISGGTLQTTSTKALSANSDLTVASGATLDLDGSSGSVGSLAGGGTVTNNGGATASLTAGADNASTSFSGTIKDGNHATGLVKTGSGTLTLSGVDTYTGGTKVTGGALSISADDNLGNGGTLALGNGTTLDLTASFTLAHAITIAGDPTFDVAAGQTVTISSTISDGAQAGELEKTGGGTLVLSAGNTYSGGTTIEGGTLELGSSTAAGSGAITFGSDVTLAIDGTTMPSNTIDGFTAGDTIDLTSIRNVSGSHVDMNYQTNVLTITEGGTTYQLDFNPNESFAHDYFHLAADGSGTSIMENGIACYCRGTLIAVASEEVPVERLAIGDKVLTASGALRPIKWIGRRSYGGRFILGRKDILPICFKADALGDGLPRRDLLISPRHAMYFEHEGRGVLIEARDLVNGVSIVQVEQIEEVEYFHIELDGHDVIIAEGALSETFVDDDSRGMFHNVHEYAELYSNEVMLPARYCAPRLDHGREVEAVRRKLAGYAGLVSSRANRGGLRGHIDLVSANGIEGWAQNIDHPEAPVCLDIYADGILIGQTLANVYREDLEAAGLGSGRHAFAFAAPDGVFFSPGAVEVRRSFDHRALRGPKARRATARAA